MEISICFPLPFMIHPLLNNSRLPAQTSSTLSCSPHFDLVRVPSSKQLKKEEEGDHPQTKTTTVMR